MGPNFLASKSSISDSGEIDYPPISGLELPSQPMVDWSSKTIQEKIARLIELQTFQGTWSGSESEIFKFVVRMGRRKVSRDNMTLIRESVLRRLWLSGLRFARVRKRVFVAWLSRRREVGSREVGRWD
ncbi:uncharacterized protein K444DRAFT_609634 [Hyaloscypha bicolor E]|uniref:Uncharacterized protein n=1 Tax=Hyaloscypha bicolor E TaxID=1095630 RepID=A0A2J6TLG0_9HELO|nr:uncharacterized protein K444DRAFT_609634 [Hyaloscypha bicolor E]PMD63822.1 hypothetical protein K444DRAFT_609634 [Hyaloscypha bicolor E]